MAYGIMPRFRVAEWGFWLAMYPRADSPKQRALPCRQALRPNRIDRDRYHANIVGYLDL
jgi:hypothetical protein